MSPGEEPLDILAIGDSHWRSTDRLDRAHALGRLILRRRPDVVIILGDWFDMPSLGSHRAPSPLGTGDQLVRAEGLRVVADIEAGCAALDAMLEPLRQFNQRRRATSHHHRQYRPRLIFLEGNHEERLRRLTLLHPQLRGFLDDAAIADAVVRRGFEWHPFLRPVEVAGVVFSHFFATPGTGKPIQISGFPSKIPFSAVWGHTHALHYRRQETTLGRSISGLCLGTFRDPDATDEWSGVAILHGAAAGAYDLETISTRRLLAGAD